MESKELFKKTSNATKWSLITEIVARLISPITNMILARILTPDDFGVVATVTMITSFADIFTDAGFQKFLIQHDFDSKDELNAHANVAFWSNFSISIFLWLLILVFNNKIATIVGNPNLGYVIVIAAISLPLTSFSSIQLAIYKRNFNFESLFYIRMITSCVPIIITVPLAIATRSFWALIIGTLATHIMNAILLTYKSRWKPRLFYDFHILKDMFSYSWWILLESITTWMTSYIGTFIVGLYLSNYYIGLYKTSMTTINQIFSLITAATSMPLFAALSRLKNDKDNLTKTYRGYIQATSVFVFPLGIGIWLYKDLVTTILLGNQWVEASNFIGLWGLLSSISLILGTYCNGLFNAVGKTYLSFIAQILHLIVLVPVLIVAAPRGYEVLYISRSFVRIELIIVELLIMFFSLKFPVWKLFIDLIPIVISTFFMVCGYLLIHYIFQFEFLTFISVFICILIYFISLSLISKKTIINCLNAFGILSKK